MDRVEKTVFISYRRANVPWALAISQNLTHRGYDVFFDFSSIPSGDFEQIITENIQARAHFLILLTPSALERCNDPEDMFRREMEIALDCKRNIIPVILEGFDFGAKESREYFKGILESVRHYNDLSVNAEYFEAVMERLCKQFLNIPLDRVKHPELPQVSSKTQQIVDEQKRVVAKQPPVEERILSAQEWFERAFIAIEPEEKIRLYTKAIELDRNFACAYNNRGFSYTALEQYKKAIADYNQAIKLDPKCADAYYNRGIRYVDMEKYEKAMADYDQAIKNNPKYAMAYYNRGNRYADKEQYEKAIADYDQAIKNNPKYDKAYYNRGLGYENLRKYVKAIEDYDQAIKLNPELDNAYYHKARSCAHIGKMEEVLKNLRQAFRISPQKYCDLAGSDRAFEKVRGNADFQNLIKEFGDKH